MSDEQKKQQQRQVLGCGLVFCWIAPLVCFFNGAIDAALIWFTFDIFLSILAALAEKRMSEGPIREASKSTQIIAAIIILVVVIGGMFFLFSIK